MKVFMNVLAIGCALVGGSFFFATGLGAANKDPKTERLWKAKCASCHGVDGKGQTEQGKKMSMHDITTAAWQKSFTDEQIKQVILDGVDEQKEGKHKQMDPYKAKLKPEQVDLLVAYCRGLAT
jgi:mono/diheme cytochrome c family protein